MGRDTATKGARGGGGCMCAAFVLALFGTVSPYWVWNYSYIVGRVSSTVGTGTFVVSSSSNQYNCGWFVTCIVNKQWNEFSDFNNTACEAEFFEEFGRYGFCKGGAGGTFQRPSAVSSIEGLVISTTVFLFVGSILACTAPAAGGSRSGFAAAVCSLVAMCTSCAAFSVASSYDWYNDLRRGTTTLPFIANSDQCPDGGCFYLQQLPNSFMYWGPAFWSFVTVFIITLFTTTSLFAASKNLDDNDLDGSYGSGNYGAAEEFGYGRA